MLCICSIGLTYLLFSSVFSDEELNELLDRSDMIGDKNPTSESDDSGIEARAFKEYYGYTGIKKEDSHNEELNSGAQIVDEDSNDAPCEVSPVRRSPVKKVNGVSENAQHAESKKLSLVVKLVLFFKSRDVLCVNISSSFPT